MKAAFLLAAYKRSILEKSQATRGIFTQRAKCRFFPVFFFTLYLIERDVKIRSVSVLILYDVTLY